MDVNVSSVKNNKICRIIRNCYLEKNLSCDIFVAGEYLVGQLIGDNKLNEIKIVFDGSLPDDKIRRFVEYVISSLGWVHKFDDHDLLNLMYFDKYSDNNVLFRFVVDIENVVFIFYVYKSCNLLNDVYDRVAGGLSNDLICYDVKLDVGVGVARSWEQNIISPKGDYISWIRDDFSRIMKVFRYACDYNCDLSYMLTGFIGQLVDSKDSEFINYFKFDNFAAYRAEFIKCIMSDNASKIFTRLHDCGVLKYILPQVSILSTIKQNKPTANNAFIHTMQVLKLCPRDLGLRIAAIFHDVGKYETNSAVDDRFYRHEVISSNKVIKWFKCTGFGSQIIDGNVEFVVPVVPILISNHMHIGGLVKSGVITSNAVSRLHTRCRGEHLRSVLLAMYDRLCSVKEENRVNESIEYYRLIFELNKRELELKHG